MTDGGWQSVAPPSWAPQPAQPAANHDGWEPVEAPHWAAPEAPVESNAPHSLPMAQIDGDDATPDPHVGQHFVAGGKGGAWEPDSSAAPLGERFAANVGEGFRNTLTGQAIDANQSGQMERDKGQAMLGFAANARKAGSGDSNEIMMPTEGRLGVRRMTVGQAETEGNSLLQTAQQKAAAYAPVVAGRAAEDQAIEPWSSEPTLGGKLAAGATALAGQLVGGSASPEMLLGGAGTRPLAAGEAALPWLAKETGVAAGANAGIGAVTDTTAQMNRVDRGEQPGISGSEVAGSAGLGALIGGGMHLAPHMAGHVVDVVSPPASPEFRAAVGTLEHIAGMQPGEAAAKAGVPPAPPAAPLAGGPEVGVSSAYNPRTTTDDAALGNPRAARNQPVAEPEKGISSPDAPPISTAESAPPAATAQNAASFVNFRPSDLTLDPERFQYKASDERGVTGALSGVQKWEPALADPITVWQGDDGRNYVVNGHQRTDLATRAEAAGQPGVQIPARVYSEADGYTPQDMRTLGAYQNIAQGSGTAVDAAKVLRGQASAPSAFQLPELPPRQAIVQQARGLQNLSPEAFGAVVNDVVPAPYAAEVGHAIADPQQQMAALSVLAKSPPANVEQARFMVHDIRNSGFLAGSQDSLFGNEAFAQSLFPERARVLNTALSILRRNKTVFRAAVDGEDTLGAAGNEMNRAGNEQGKADNDQLIDQLHRDATTRGPLSDALTASARDVSAGRPATAAAADFINAARRIPGGSQSVAVEPGTGDHGTGSAGERDAGSGTEPEWVDSEPPLFSARDGSPTEGGADRRPEPTVVGPPSRVHGALSDLMHATMRYAGMPPDVGLRLVNRLTDAASGKSADAAYTHDLITFALDTPPDQVAPKLFHEIVHGLMDPKLGLIGQQARRALEIGADRFLQQSDNRAQIEAAYGKDPALVREEAIARMAEQVVQDAKGYAPLVPRVVDRMRNFITGVGQALRGEGFTTADDVFRSITRGRMSGEAERIGLASAARDGWEQAEAPSWAHATPDAPSDQQASPDEAALFSRRQEDSRQDDLLGKPAPRNRAGPTQQDDMFGTKDGAVQAQAARDQVGRGALLPNGPQKAADEGLFAPDTSGQGKMFSLRDDEGVRGLPGFYSAVGRAALDLPQAKGSGEQMLAMLSKHAGVKPEEMKWLGLPEWLRSQKSVTKQQVLDYVRANALRVEETNYGRPVSVHDYEKLRTAATDAAKVARQAIRNEDNLGFDSASEALTSIRQHPTDWQDRWEVDDPAARAALQAYVEAVQKRDAAAGSETYFGAHRTEGGENYRELLLTLPKDESGQNYTSSHWDPKNVVAHTRVADFASPDGRRVLVAHEIQSDWHQAGRQKGYAASPDQYGGMDRRSEELLAKGRADKEAGIETPEADKQEWADLMNRMQASRNAVPDAPFKTSWPMLAMKRLIKMAVDEGHDRLAWDTGDTSADRFDLSKQVSKLDYVPSEGNIYAFGPDGRHVQTFRDVSPEKMPEIIGKDAAKKLLEQPESAAVDGSGRTFKRLEGADLKVGGDGMRGFYDQILPKETQKLLGKYGAQVTRSEINVPNPDFAVDLNSGRLGSESTNGADAYTPMTVHSLDITPAMRKAVQEDGLPLFSLRDDRPPAERERNVQQFEIAFASEKPAGTLVKMGDSIAKIFSPTSRGNSAASIEQIIRRNAAEGARSYAQVVHTLSDARDALGRLSVEDQRAFTDRMEAGEAQPTPAMQAIAGALRKTYDQWTDRIRSLGKGQMQNARENYMAHIWANHEDWSNARMSRHPDGTVMTPEEVQEAAQNRSGAAGQSKSPIRGSGAFLKQRSFETQAEGIAAGLIPVSDNPVNMAMIKLREVQKYYWGTRMANEIKAADLARWVAESDKFDATRAGMVKMDDRVFNPTTPMPEGTLTHGAWWAQEPVARVFNNYVSHGIAGDPIYDALRAGNNGLNMMQLGLSGFHAAFITQDTIISRGALALEQAARGDLRKAIGTASSLPFAPITTISRGAALRRAILLPEAATPEMRRAADLAIAGGARTQMGVFYQATGSGAFVKSLKDLSANHIWNEVTATAQESARQAGKIGAAPLTALKLATRALETVSEPLMGAMVPRAKLGVFYELARDWTQANPDATPEASAAAMTKFWDSVDNRMGQMVYDNLFWNKTLKDIAFVATRSVGWNLGTLREIGGAAVDTAAAAGKMVQGRAPTLTSRMAYTIMMPAVVATEGAMLNYLLSGHGPQQMLDYFYPKDAASNRISIPGYIKDVIDWTHAPIQTAENKASPLISTASQLANNRDYYGGIIFDPQRDNFAKAYMDFLLNDTIPFSLRSIEKENQQGSGPLEKALAFWGFQPAPAAIAQPEKGERFQARENLRAYKQRQKESGRMEMPWPQ